MDASKLATFIESGNWSGEKVKLENEHWKNIIERMLSEANNIFQYLSGFSPISSLIINEKLMIRDEGSLVFFHGLNMDTHCHQITEIFIGSEEDKSQRKIITTEERYFITRKKEWLVWKRTTEIIFIEQSGIINDNRRNLLYSDFAKVDLDYILNKKGSLGCSIVSNIFSWLKEDIQKSEGLLDKKREAIGFVRDIFHRSILAN